MVNGDTIAGLTTYYVHGSFLGTLSVTNGYGPTGDGDTSKYSLPGTCLFLTTAYNFTILGDPAQYGSPSPDGYGTVTSYARDAVITNSVTSPANSAGGIRRACIQWILRGADGSVSNSGSGTQAIFALSTNLVLTWYWTNEYQLSVAAAAGGTASVERSGWYTNGLVVDVSATPTGNYSFTEWTGDVPAGQATSNPLSLLMDRPRAVSAQFASMVAQTRVWSGVNPWETTTNWTPEGMPSSNDTAIISGGTTLLANARSVANLIVTNGGVVLFTNWSTVLSVTGQVTVLSNGALRAAGPFTDTQMSNRIVLVCSDLVVATGGVITADGVGYAGSTNNGFGLGRGLYASRSSGAGHGGLGGDAIDNGSLRLSGGTTNDAPDWPTLPGSSGGGYDVTRLGGHGGGAIVINATNATVQGTISANGLSGGSYCGGGAGGSIRLSCTTLSGKGLIAAHGGSGNANSGGGGGGRIALIYTTLNGPLPRCEASAGNGPANGWLRSPLPPFVTPAGAGSLYISRTNDWLGAGLPSLTNVQLIVPGFSSWTLPSLSLSNTIIRFEPGFNLTIAGELKITSSNAGLIFTGDPGLNCGALSLDGGQLVTIGSTQLVCNGDLRLTNGGILAVQSALTSGVGTAYGTYVTVAGDVLIATNSWILPVSAWTNGGSVLFSLKNLQINSGGGVDADSRGFDGGYMVNGFGPGGGLYHGNRGSGAGHGGIGGWSYWTAWCVAGGTNYGMTNGPSQPGSGGGGVASRSGGGSGGGLVRVEASSDIRLDGIIRANGGDGGGDCGGGSGGGITLICGGQFIGGSTGRLLANGGNGNGAQGGGGGGGRIAVWHDTSPAQAVNALAAGRTTFIAETNYNKFAGIYSVSNGTGPGMPPDVHAAYPGTCYFLTLPKGGSIFTFY